MKSLPLIALLCSSFLLSACVTTVESRLTRKADPEKAVDNYTQLGLGYIQQGRFDRARARINRALEINPKYAPANNAMALLLQSEREPELAEEYFLKSIDLDSDFSQGQYNYGMFLMRNDRFDKACYHLNNAAQDVEYQQRGKAFQNLGLCYYRAGKIDLAITTYERMLKVQRFNAPVLVNLSTLLYEKERFDDAQQYFNRFTRLVNRQKSQHSANSLWLGIRLARVNKNSSEEERLAQALQANFPDSEEYKRFQSF